jgi:hypothetical protein
MRQWCLSAGFLFSLAVVLGCGGGNRSSANLTVTGKVTLKGAPAKNVTVKLTDAKGAEYMGTTDAEGKFSISAVPAGEMKVAITETHASQGPAMDAKTKAMMKEKMKEAMKGEVPVPVEVESSKVPAKYGTPATSGLSWTISPENLTKDFTLDG